MQFAKALQVLEEDPLVYARNGPMVSAASSTSILGKIDRVEYVRNATANGYKALYQDRLLSAETFWPR